jgi:hypothetical protein
MSGTAARVAVGRPARPDGPNGPDRPDGPDARASRSVLASVASEFERIYAELEPIGKRFAGLLDTGDRITREELASLRPAVFAVLAKHRELVAGAGVFTVPGLLADAEYWLEWWWTRPSGSPEALRVNLDPAAPDFFDYPTADWYATPMATARAHISGPYVDYACTNQYALTVALPIASRGRLIGVAASDVLVSSLERRILPSLRRLRHPAMLVNSGGRVVVSNSPDYSPGERVPSCSAPDSPTTSKRRRGLASATAGWQIVRSDRTADPGNAARARSAKGAVCG